MVVLVVAALAASFLLGVMVGERSGAGLVAQGGAPARPPMAQVPAPPLPGAAPAGAQKLTFYEDLPRGNAAPLGSGINLPKSAYVPPPATATAAPAPVTPVTAPSPPPAPEAKAPAAEAKAAPVAAPKANSGGNLVVQVSATKDQAEAKRLADKLNGKGFAAAVERADLGAKGVWYRVTVGPYADRAAADKAVAQLKQLKYSAMVRSR
jgi:cell division septation protein DedD